MRAEGRIYNVKGIHWWCLKWWCFGLLALNSLSSNPALGFFPRLPWNSQSNTQAKKKEVFSNIKKPIGLNCHARHALNCGTLCLKIPKRENEAESILCPFAQFSKCDSIIILKKTHVVNYDPELFKMFFSVFGAKVAASCFLLETKVNPSPTPTYIFAILGGHTVI